MRLEDYLRFNASKFKNKVAVVCGGISCTYGELFDLVCRRVAAISLDNSKFVPFYASQTIDFLVNYFAIHLAGGVAIPLDRNIPEMVLNNMFESLRSCNVPEDIADILYTTGTTGIPKGVMLSHKAIIANAENLIYAQQYTEDLTFIICGPLNHIGSLSKIYPIILCGATLYILDNLKDLNKFYEALEFPCPKMATFLVPASIRILIRFSAERLGKYTQKIDFIETGAAPISPDDMLRLCDLLPASRLYNTYASTESGIVATYNFNDGRCLVGCVGKQLKNSSIWVSPLGLIMCKGDTLMSGYAGDPASTKDVLCDGTLITKDLGFFDDEGLLHLQGRNDDIINVGGFKVAPVEVENVTLSISGVKDCICVAVPHPISGTALKLLIVVEPRTQFDKYAIAAFLKTKLEPYKVPLLYECVSEIVRTYNGKLDRKAYR